MKKSLESFKDKSAVIKQSTNSSIGEKQGETKNLEEMFLDLSNLLES